MTNPFVVNIKKRQAANPFVKSLRGKQPSSVSSAKSPSKRSVSRGNQQTGSRLDSLLTLGYGTRRTGTRWCIVDRYSNIIAGEKRYADDRQAQQRADELNRRVYEMRAEVLCD